MNATPMVIALATLACAHGSPAAETDSRNAAVLGEVVVTAQKRAESLQDVPISISVVTADSLQSLDMSKSTDLQYRVPGVQANLSSGPRNFGFYIRGIGSSSFASESIEGSVAYVVDGVVYAQPGAGMTDLPDIERVEVLRGPQGTLYGINASGGVVNVVTRKPSRDFSVEGRVSLADPLAQRKTSLYVTGPIGGSAALSVSGRYSSHNGLIKNVFDDRHFNDDENFGFRSRLAITPSDSMTIDIVGDYWERNSHCCVWTLASVGPVPTAIEQLALDAGIVPSFHNLEQNLDGDVIGDQKSYGLSAQIDLELVAGHTLTSISAWRRWSSHDGFDTDSSPVDILNHNYAEPMSQRQLSQEFRLTSPQSDVVDYVAGVFYMKSDVDTDSQLIWPSVPVLTLASHNTASNQHMGVYGQGNLHFSDSLTGIVGARMLHDKYEASKERDFYEIATRDFIADSKTDTDFVWRLGLQYALSADVGTFATVTRGYKGGGYDTNVYTNGLPSVDAEKPMNYELGLRTVLSPGLTWNTTLFWTNVADYQVQSRQPGAESPIFLIRNAAEVESRGIETALNWRPLSEIDWQLSFDGALTDAKWKRFTSAQCFTGQTAAQGCDPASGTQDVTGQRVPFSSKWQFSLDSQHRADLGHALALVTSINVAYRSRAATIFPDSPETQQPGYYLLNASIGLAAVDDRWQIALFGRNLADERYASQIQNTPFGSGLVQYPVYEARRIVGLSASFKL